MTLEMGLAVSDIQTSCPSAELLLKHVSQSARQNYVGAGGISQFFRPIFTADWYQAVHAR